MRERFELYDNSPMHVRVGQRLRNAVTATLDGNWTFANDDVANDGAANNGMYFSPALNSSQSESPVRLVTGQTRKHGPNFSIREV